jgi:formiminoglutamate deiminase
MYDVAARLDPDSYLDLATAVFTEMVAAGITTVGEFHYLHHQPDGTPYDDPNAMSLAVIEAAGRAGLRLTLLDTCYLTAGIGRPPEGVQSRFSDGDVDRWGERLDRLGDLGDRRDAVRVAGAYHSVRAVPRDQMRTRTPSPLHIHLSEQVAENDECLAAYGLTPTQVFAEAGHLTERNTLVHATHLTDDDVRLIGDAHAFASFCPTTERDLGDGIGPSRRLHDAGARLTLGSDSHAVIDPFEEMRALELDERLATRQRGHWSAPELLTAATVDGHASLGWDDAGSIAVGQRADLVVVDPASPRTAGAGRDEGAVVFAAAAEDVQRVMADGRWIVEEGQRYDIGLELEQAVARTWGEAR